MPSLVIPVYRNEASLPDLLAALTELDRALGGTLEVVFVVDGSPDHSMEQLERALPGCPFRSQLLLLSRNFGSFAAIRTGLAAARGPHFAVMAADLQEPPELVLQFYRTLENEPVDIVLGTRTGRDDPALSRWSARLFWALYRRLVLPEMPPGGVDVFGCNAAVRDQLLLLDESHSSLVGLLLWVGFRRRLVPYARRARQHGKSAWSWRRKYRYFLDSVFSFSDLPIRLLITAGALGLLASIGLAVIVLLARLQGRIPIPGYTATILTITFFSALNTFGIGIIGAYVWRAFENTKSRPGALVMRRVEFEGRAP